MFRSDESLRLGTAENRDSGHASRTAAPTHALDISGVPAAHSDARAARRARLLARPRRTSARFVRARGRGARGERALVPSRSPPPPRALASASRPAGIPAVNGQGAGDVTFARISRSGPRDRPRALATRALARVPPPPHPLAMASSVAAAHATLAALAFASSARATAAPRAPRRGGFCAPGGLADDRPRFAGVDVVRAGRPGSGSRRGALSSVVAPRARSAPSAMSGNGGDTNIFIPDTFTPLPARASGRAQAFFPPVGVADEPSVANPLQRLKRLSTEWFGCVFELEGVLIEAREAEHRASWMKLASERGEPPVPEMVLKFASTSKPEDFIQRQLRWTRDPDGDAPNRAEEGGDLPRDFEARRASVGPSLLPGVRPFLETLAGASVPMAATCGTMSFSELRATLETLDILRFFENPDSPRRAELRLLRGRQRLAPGPAPRRARVPAHGPPAQALRRLRR